MAFGCGQKPTLLPYRDGWVDKDIYLELLLILDNNRRINIEAKGKVVRKVGDGLGIKFKNMDRETQNRIIEYSG